MPRKPVKREVQQGAHNDIHLSDIRGSAEEICRVFKEAEAGLLADGRFTRIEFRIGCTYDVFAVISDAFRLETTEEYKRRLKRNKDARKDRAEEKKHAADRERELYEKLKAKFETPA